MAVYTMTIQEILSRELMKGFPERPKNELYEMIPDDVIGLTWKSLFDFDFPVWETQTKAGIAKIILREYYVREIGSETVGLFKLRLRSKMLGIMPYYTQIGNLRLKREGLLFITDTESRKTEIGRKEERSETNKGSALSDSAGNDSSHSVSNQTQKGVTKRSETPQDGLAAVEDGTYLTEATIDETTNTGNVDSDGSNSLHQETSSEASGNIKGESSENVKETKEGFHGDSLDILNRAKELLTPLELEILEKVSSLFMSVYE